MPYELYKGRNPNISYLHVFRRKCFVLNKMKGNLRKFDANNDKGIFLGYSTSSQAFIIFNKITLTVEESIHVTSDESNPSYVEVEVVSV